MYSFKEKNIYKIQSEDFAYTPSTMNNNNSLIISNFILLDISSLVAFSFGSFSSFAQSSRRCRRSLFFRPLDARALHSLFLPSSTWSPFFSSTVRIYTPPPFVSVLPLAVAFRPRFLPFYNYIALRPPAATSRAHTRL